MIRLAARYADLWDTFPELPGTATDGVTTSVAERMAAFEAACRAAGRDSTEVRRSTWAEADVGASEGRFVDFARRHVELGFTDISVIPPATRDLPTLRRIALERIPELRAEFAR
jgi:alkanesulfonate monooxygenase SsuD/methylene tetrahydromethanopterin reductase-like flavin-dependent oxidoreductase (luciferase family)